METRYFRRAFYLLCAVAAAGVAAVLLRSHAPRPNLIVVLVDTLRADHLGVYGYARATSPTLDALAAESVLFDNARSQAPCTFPSVNSLLTSRHPLEFLGQPEERIGIPDTVPALSEILAAHGYRTAAVSASGIVRKTPSKFNLAGGFDRGFDVFDESCLRQSAQCVNEAALRHLAELARARPFFLYLHYYDPHAPYRPPEDFTRPFGRHYAGRKRFIRRGDP